MPVGKLDCDKPATHNSNTTSNRIGRPSYQRAPARSFTEKRKSAPAVGLAVAVAVTIAVAIAGVGSRSRLVVVAGLRSRGRRTRPIDLLRRLLRPVLSVPAMIARATAAI